MTTETSSPEPTSNDPLIDWSVLDAFRAMQRPGNPDICCKLMGVYLDSSPKLVTAINAALAAADAPALATAAHSLKSSSMSVGAVALGALCAELELRGKQAELGDTEQLSRLVDIQFAAVVAAFQQEISARGA